MKEEAIQQQVAEYLRLQYPDVLFHSDFGSGARLTPSQAAKQKRQNGGQRGWPDMFIAEPTCYENCGCDIWKHGLFIELKREGVKLHPGPRSHPCNSFHSLDGKDYQTTHLREQADALEKLRQRGYVAEFAVGFDEAKKIIDKYLGAKEVLNEN